MKKVIALSAIILQVSVLSACTTFFINNNGQLVFGRNYDWVTGTGMVCTNLRGLSKTSIDRENGRTISWTSQYGSITFNQYGKELPTGGMNEKGLVVELMWLDETKYPAVDSRPAVNVLQWVQYQLDNCTTIDDVIATDKKLRITSNDVPLHYLVADANGNAATIEFLQGKMVVHKGQDLSVPVLSNSTYDESVNAYRSSSVNGNNSLERFAKACNMIKTLHTGSITKHVSDYAFDILSSVSQGNYTKWSIVYDITNKTIQFKTNAFKQIKTVNFSAFDLSCSSVSRAWDMNQPGTGTINVLFENFTPAINKRIVEAAAKESKNEIPLDQRTIELMWQYASNIKCR